MLLAFGIYRRQNTGDPVQMQAMTIRTITVMGTTFGQAWTHSPPHI